MNKKYLLPTGFYDLLGDEAKVNQKAIDILLQKFDNFGYGLIKTPLVEFEETYDSSSSSFKMVDISSGNSLAIRSDITTQISRLFATKLKEENIPLRLCYVGDVLKVKNDNLYADRQLTQAGIELIGSDSTNANQEVVDIILQGLNDIKLPNLLIDFCIPQFLESLLQDLKVDNNAGLKLAIEQKNISLINKFGEKYADDLMALVLHIGDFSVINDKLSNLPISKKIQDKITDLKQIVKNVQKNAEISVSVNIFGDNDFLYHEDMAFTIFEEGFDYPIARGGRYKIDEKTPAVGATIYINNLRKILIRMPIKRRESILVPVGTEVEEINNMHKKGYITINSLYNKNPSKQVMSQEAKKSNCDLIYWDRAISKF